MMQDPGVCLECGRPMRPHGVKLADAPGTVPRQRDGQCTSCSAKHRPRPHRAKTYVCDPEKVRREAAWRLQYEIGRLIRGVDPDGMPVESLRPKPAQWRPLP